MDLRFSKSSSLPPWWGLVPILAMTAIPAIFSLSELFEEPDNAFNPAIKIGDVELFVGGVKVVVGKAKAHHHAGDFEHALEVGDHGNRSS